VGENGDLLLRADVLFGGTLDLHLLWMAADCEESLYEHIPQSLLSHSIFSKVCHVESIINFSPQLIFTTYLKYFLLAVPYLILCTMCSDIIPLNCFVKTQHSLLLLRTPRAHHFDLLTTKLPPSGLYQKQSDQNILHDLEHHINVRYPIIALTDTV
jgi:hypothetical protein